MISLCLNIGTRLFGHGTLLNPWRTLRWRFRVSGHLNQRAARSPTEQKQTNAKIALQLGRDRTKASTTRCVFKVLPKYVCLRFRISGHLNRRTAPAEQKQTSA
eukprot:3832180-Alexandrium_andersonii.AAC.1